MMNRSAAMALFLPLFFVLLLATGGQADADEPSTTSHRAVPQPPPALKGFETSRRPPAATGGHNPQKVKIGPCFLSRGANAPSCLKRCTSKGYAGGLCDTVSGGFPGDCYCLKAQA